MKEGYLNFDGRQIKIYGLPRRSYPNSRRIECFYKRKNGEIWIGTRRGGLWKYDNKKFSLIPDTYGKTICAIAFDDEETMWMATPVGCMYTQHGQTFSIPGLNSFCASLILLGKDSVLIGSQNGPVLVVNKKVDRRLIHPV